MGQNNLKLSAAGYCRTSGEMQRDNTSIPRQKADIEKFIAKNEWQLVHHYVDESISGSKIEGRYGFKQMMRDAANRQFDIIVIYDISRFARDGTDIIRESHFLKSNFGVDVIDTKGFDTRKYRNALLNFVFAGVAEDERLRIMDRTIRGRIHNAEQGLPWAPISPFGRAFEKAGKHSGKWYVTEKGRKLSLLLERYVKGEALRNLAKEYGFTSSEAITRIVRESQLSAGTYIVKFNSLAIGIENLEVPIPNFPAIITPELEKKVVEKMQHSKICNKEHKKKYLLSGFIRCAHCGKSLTGQTLENRVYYCHHNFYVKDRHCLYRSIRAEVLEQRVLDHLYTFFFDEPAYSKAVKAALPSNADREAVELDISRANKEIAKINSQISNLVNAIANGADVNLLLNKQSELKERKQVLENRLSELNQTLINMPNPETIQTQAITLRSRMLVNHIVKDWRKMSYDDIRQFLHFLFSDNPYKNDYGIFLAFKNGKWYIKFSGCIDFRLGLIITDKATENNLRSEIDKINSATLKSYEEGIAHINKVYSQKIKELSPRNEELKPEIDYL